MTVALRKDLIVGVIWWFHDYNKSRAWLMEGAKKFWSLKIGEMLNFLEFFAWLYS